MRAWELISGIQVPISEEEAELIEDLASDEDKKLSEREEIVAENLVKKGVLDRIEEKDHDRFRIIKAPDVWRD